MITYDFHIHSALSPCGDNEMTPNNIVNMAAVLGLSCIAVSDHNTVGNARAAMLAGEKVTIKDDGGNVLASDFAVNDLIKLDLTDVNIKKIKTVDKLVLMVNESIYRKAPWEY